VSRRPSRRGLKKKGRGEPKNTQVVSTGGGQALEIPVAECDGPQHLVCVEDDCPPNVVPGGRVSHPRLDLRVDVLTVIRVLGGDNVILALLGEDI